MKTISSRGRCCTPCVPSSGIPGLRWQKGSGGRDHGESSITSSVSMALGWPCEGGGLGWPCKAVIGFAWMSLTGKNPPPLNRKYSLQLWRHGHAEQSPWGSEREMGSSCKIRFLIPILVFPIPNPKIHAGGFGSGLWV